MNSRGERDRHTRFSANAADTSRHGRRAAVAIRGIGFLGFWFVLAGINPADLPAAALAVATATWTSLYLLPAGSTRPSPVALVRLACRFVYQSVAAGADVARRALDPRLPLRPGFVTYPVGFPPGPARNVFATITSLLPGTVPAGDDDGRLIYHCLDVDQPVVSQLAAEEASLARVIGNE